MAQSEVQAGWRKIVDAARANGLSKKQIPTGTLKASSDGEETSFKSNYRGPKIK